MFSLWYELISQKHKRYVIISLVVALKLCCSVIRKKITYNTAYMLAVKFTRLTVIIMG